MLTGTVKNRGVTVYTFVQLYEHEKFDIFTSGVLFLHARGVKNQNLHLCRVLLISVDGKLNVYYRSITFTMKNS